MIHSRRLHASGVHFRFSSVAGRCLGAVPGVGGGCVEGGRAGGRSGRCIVAPLEILCSRPRGDSWPGGRDGGGRTTVVGAGRIDFMDGGFTRVPGAGPGGTGRGSATRGTAVVGADVTDRGSAARGGGVFAGGTVAGGLVRPRDSGIRGKELPGGRCGVDRTMARCSSIRCATAGPGRAGGCSCGR